MQLISQYINPRHLKAPRRAAADTPPPQKNDVSFQQCARKPGLGVGGPHLARQLGTLARMVPPRSGGVRGERRLLLASLSPPRFGGRVAHSTTRLARQVRRSGRGRGRAWPFDARCWLAASEGDGQVERVLRVCAEAPGFSQVEMLTQHTNKK